MVGLIYNGTFLTTVSSSLGQTGIFLFNSIKPALEKNQGIIFCPENWFQENSVQRKFSTGKILSKKI